MDTLYWKLSKMPEIPCPTCGNSITLNEIKESRFCKKCLSFALHEF